MSGAVRPEVVVIGDALLDVTVRPATAVRAGADVPGDVRIGCGGQGANLAVRLARRGVAVELVCGLGDDASASFVRGALDAEGVRVTSVPVAATGTVVILLEANGERTMVSRRAQFGADAPIPSAEVTLVSGYLFLEPGVQRVARSLADGGSRRIVAGCAVPDDARAAWRGAVGLARPDLLVVNHDEALGPAPLEALAGGIVVTSTDRVTATIGANEVEVGVPAGTPAVDTTGAGDAFAAVLVAALLRSPWPPAVATLEAALAAAVRIASQVARAPGAQSRVAAEAGT